MGERNPNALTPRELETVLLVVEGLKNDEIAVELGISRRTVHAHLSSAMSKTATHTRTQLAVQALRAGLAPMDRVREGEGQVERAPAGRPLT